MDKHSKILILGSTGFVGSAIVRILKSQGYENLHTPRRAELDLFDLNSVENYFKENEPEFVFLAAAKVGGILANSKYPADFLYENIQIQNNVIHTAHKFKVNKLLFLGSSCIYPKEPNIPIKETELLTGPLEYTNEGYAIAKIAGLTLCKKYFEQYGDNFISAMPTNIYGVNDNFHLENSHVIPALIRRFDEAKDQNLDSVTVWGSGKPMREFLYVDDLAEGLIFLMNNYSDKEHVNIGTGSDISIKELAETIKKLVGFKGELIFDTTKPDGTMRKVMDVSKINKLGWKASTDFRDGLERTYEWYLKKVKNNPT